MYLKFGELRTIWDEPGRQKRRDEVALEYQFARGRHGCELKISLANWQFSLLCFLDKRGTQRGFFADH